MEWSVDTLMSFFLMKASNLIENSSIVANSDNCKKNIITAV
jgi:hypothetical protein